MGARASPCAPQMRELALGALARRTPANGSRRSIRELSFPGQAAASAAMLRIFFIKMRWRRSFQIAAVPHRSEQPKVILALCRQAPCARSSCLDEASEYRRASSADQV